MSTRLSVVATSRNDGHGGHLVERMQWFVNGLDHHARSTGTDVELIMVEWNPPEASAPLADVIRWPARGPLIARVVTVPKSVHDAYSGATQLPLFQMIAKNVGIRRATGEYVLATNVDVLLSDELGRFLVNDLQPHVLYRADRYDVDLPLDREMTVPEVLEYCAEHPLRMMRQDGVYYPGRGRVVPHCTGALDYARAELHRWAKSAVGRGNTPLARSPSSSARRSLSSSLHGVVDKCRSARDHRVLPRLHTNACGDFTLLARDDWSLLRGYPEWPMFSWNLDSVLLYQAAAAGIGEVDLPPTMPVFHIEHEKGSGWTPEGHGDLFGRLDRGGVEYLTDRGLRLEAVRLVRKARRGIAEPLNGPSWGLGDEDLGDEVCAG
jgi:hypothetical protein